MADKPKKTNKKEEVKSLTLRNHHIQIISQWLSELKLNGTDTRIRNRFFLIIGQRLNELAVTKQEIIVKYADKKDGKVVTEKKPVIDGTGAVAKLQDVPVFKEVNEVKADAEHLESLQEEFVIDILSCNPPTAATTAPARMPPYTLNTVCRSSCPIVPSGIGRI